MRKFPIIIFFIGIFCVQVVSAQDQYLKKADRLYEHSAYPEAAAIYLSFLQQSYNYNINYKLADCYFQMNLLADAEHWYEILLTQNPDDEKSIYNYAMVLKANGNYKTAKQWFLKYATFNEDGYYLASSCDWALMHLNTAPEFIIDTLAFNTKNSEITPTFFKKGIIYAATAGERVNVSTGMSYYDLVYSERKADSTWNTSSLGNSVNSDLHEAAPYYDINSKTLYFTRNNQYKNRTIKSKDGDVKLEIFFSSNTDGKFSAPKPANLNSKSYSVGQPALSPDGTIMVFASDRPGGNGGIDLYFSIKKNGSWSAPKNLGDAINTPGNEEFPFMSEDGTLYFSSDWLQGFGGMDVFKSVRQGNSWTTPKNLGLPVNSAQDDFAFIIKNGTGYFTSNRIGGKGSDDIYAVTQVMSLTKIYVFDTNMKPVAKARISLVESPKSNVIIETDASGFADISSLTGPGISIRISREGFLDKTINGIGDFKTSNGIFPVELQPLLGEQEQTPKKENEVPENNNN